MYFKSLPRIKYLLDPAQRGSSDVSVLLTDITVNVRFKQEVIDKITLYDYFIMKEGETYEIVSERLYGTPEYHWILMLLNDAYDWKKDVALPLLEFEEYIKDKYGSLANAQSTIRHYVNSKGFVVDSNYLNEQGQLDAKPVTVYEWEEAINNDKRKIKIISQEMIDRVLLNFKDLL